MSFEGDVDVSRCISRPSRFKLKKLHLTTKLMRARRSSCEKRDGGEDLCDKQGLNCQGSVGDYLEREICFLRSLTKMSADAAWLASHRGFALYDHTMPQKKDKIKVQECECSNL